MSHRMIKEYNESTQTLIGHKSRELMDLETGERIMVDQITKRVYGTKRFWKVYLMDFLTVLGIIDSKQLDVFVYIAENTDPQKNIFLGTYDKIAKDVGVSRPTIAKLMKKLQDNKFIRKIQAGAWFVNPNIIMKGDERKRQILLSYYESDEPIDELTFNRVKKKSYDEYVAEHTVNAPALIEGNTEIEESNIIDTGSMPKDEE